MSGSDPVLLDTTRRILRAVADPQTRRDGDAAAAWRAVDDAGLTRAWLPEAAGRAGRLARSLVGDGRGRAQLSDRRRAAGHPRALGDLRRRAHRLRSPAREVPGDPARAGPARR